MQLLVLGKSQTLAKFDLDKYLSSAFVGHFPLLLRFFDQKIAIMKELLKRSIIQLFLESFERSQ